jgi:hypothetical protein
MSWRTPTPVAQRTSCRSQLPGGRSRRFRLVIV